MALRMRHWFMVVGTCVGLALVWALPPRAPEAFQMRAKTAVEIKADRLASTVVGANETLKRLRWADSLSAMAAAVEPGAVFVAAPPGGEPRPEFVERFLERIEFERATSPMRDEEIRLGFILQPRTHGSHPDVSSSHMPNEVYIGARHGVPYCLNVNTTSGRPDGRVAFGFERYWQIPQDMETATTYSLLQLCRLPARYGIPGQQILAWLEAGGMRLAVEDRLHRLPIEALMPGLIQGETWGSRPSYWRREVSVDQCLTGDAEACGRLLSVEGVSTRIKHPWSAVASATPVTFINDLDAGGGLGYLDLFVLHEVEAEYGAESFQRFWTSEEPFEAAFQDAFGVTPGEWMLAWTRRVVGSYDAGPGTAKSAGFGSLLFLSLCAGLAGLTHRRRKVA